MMFLVIFSYEIIVIMAFSFEFSSFWLDMHNKLSIRNVHKLCKKRAKMRFLALISSLVNRFGMTLHILTQQNVPNDSVVISHHIRSSAGMTY